MNGWARSFSPWLFDHFGWTGLVIAAAFCVAAALAMLLRVLLRTLAPVHAMIATVLACGLAIPHALSRPHIFTLPILVAWVAALVRARSEDRAPSLWLAPLMVLWANLHGGYMFGLVLAALLAGEAVLAAPDWRSRLGAARGWGLFGAWSLVAALITPFGIDGLLLPFRLTQMSYALGQLTEWQSPNFQKLRAARAVDHARVRRCAVARLAAASDTHLAAASAAAHGAPARSTRRALGLRRAAAARAGARAAARGRPPASGCSTAAWPSSQSRRAARG